MRNKFKFSQSKVLQVKTDINPGTKADLFPIVGIGASAGGLNAFTRLFKALPIDTGMAFVLIQHLDPKHVSLLPELIKRTTAMPVTEVSDGMHVEPNHIYVIPPAHSLALLHNVLHLMQRPDSGGKYLPIDDFLRSLAQDRQNNSIGIILSGTASDGTLGLQAIKAAGGITFAQSADSAEYSDMPHNAIVAGHVDFVQTPEEIARELALIARHPYLRPHLLRVEQEAPVYNEDFSKILALLRTHTGIDFTYYKPNTIQRRIKRRMVLHQLERLKDYIKFLQLHPKELDALFQDMLINVTSFFREPETFEALKQKVFPSFIELYSNKQPLRIWVPACSTGEEVYSLAIALFEFLGDKVNTMRIQIFASDIDKQAIDKARQGSYSQSILETVNSKRMQRFFTKTANGYQICRSIRDICVFAAQNITQDPPFSHINLICCRNLLIYLGISLQKKVLHTFNYALQPDGFLMLGTSETIGNENELFSAIDTKNRIFIRKTTISQPNTNLTGRSFSVHQLPAPSPGQIHAYSTAIIQQAAENVILKKYGPPGVIIDQNMQILHFRGQVGPYIEPSVGSASLNLLKMARQELVLELRSLVQQAIKENRSVSKEGLHIRHNNDYRILNLQVIPLPALKTITPNYLVLFEPGTETPIQQSGLQAEVVNEEDAKDLRIKELENNLLTEREYMQSIIEEQEGINEELQAASEEIQSTNEELQSTNEELETTKEELQSTNEELTTIIEEHENRNKELNVINNDLTNLLASIDLAIVILHKDLCIRRFTPAARLLLNLIDTDINRPISNIRPNINIPDMGRLIQQVIQTSKITSVEAQDQNGHWYTLRIQPYRTHEDQIDGAIMVFIDIDNLKNIEQLRKALHYEQHLAAVVRDSNDSVTVQDLAGHILAWNRRASEMYGYSEEEALQLNASQLIPDEAREDMRILFERLKHVENIPPCETLRRIKDGHLIRVWMTTSVLLDETGSPFAIVITERETK